MSKRFIKIDVIDSNNIKTSKIKFGNVIVY